MDNNISPADTEIAIRVARCHVVLLDAEIKQLHQNMGIAQQAKEAVLSFIALLGGTMEDDDAVIEKIKAMRTIGDAAIYLAERDIDRTVAVSEVIRLIVAAGLGKDTAVNAYFSRTDRFARVDRYPTPAPVPTTSRSCPLPVLTRLRLRPRVYRSLTWLPLVSVGVLLSRCGGVHFSREGCVDNQRIAPYPAPPAVRRTWTIAICRFHHRRGY